MGSDLNILHRDANIRDDLTGNPKRPRIIHGHNKISTGVSSLHVGDLAAHEILPLKSERVGNLSLVVGVVAIPKIPVDAQRIPVGVGRHSHERDVVIFIRRRGRGRQFHRGRMVALERANIYHHIDPWHLFPVLTLRHRRNVKAEALLHKGAADHEWRIQHTACAAGRRIEHYGQRPRTLHQ